MIKTISTQEVIGMVVAASKESMVVLKASAVANYSLQDEWTVQSESSQFRVEATCV